MIYEVAGTERRVSTGERLELVAGTVHKARNASDTETAVVRWQTRPALRSADFFTIADELGDAGMLERALLVDEYRDVFRVSGWRGALVPLIAALARLMGRRLPDV
jgi:hypothetical protein